MSASIGYEIHEFLAQEALLLDHQRYGDWATLLARDLTYRCPARLFAASAGNDEGAIADVIREYDYEFLTRHARGRPAESGTWVKSVRRLITNVIIVPGNSSKEFAITSYVLLTGTVTDARDPPLMTIE